MTNPTDLYGVPTEREFAASMLMTGLVILIIAVVIAAGATWHTTNHYPQNIHAQAMRTAIILPLVIVPLLRKHYQFPSHAQSPTLDCAFHARSY